MPSQGQVVPYQGAPSVPSNSAAETFTPKGPGTSLVPRSVNWAPPIEPEPVSGAVTAASEPLPGNAIKAGLGQARPSALTRIANAQQAAYQASQDAAAREASMGYGAKALRFLASKPMVAAGLMMHSENAGDPSEDAMFAPGGKFRPVSPAVAPTPGAHGLTQAQMMKQQDGDANHPQAAPATTVDPRTAQAAELDRLDKAQDVAQAIYQ